MANAVRIQQFAWTMSSLSLFGFTVWMVGCGGSKGSSATNFSAAYAQSVANVVQLQSGLLLYENDYDDSVPLSNWVDSTLPYVHTASYYHSPLASGLYGYALNAAIVGKNSVGFPNPDLELTFFDSTVLTRNAVAAAGTLPSPPRYGTKNTLGYLDGETQDSQDGVGAPTLYATSQKRVKQLDLGLLMYANDYDDVLPPNNQWMDGLAPYVKNSELFHSPAIENINPTEYGYALDLAIAGQSISSIAQPSTTVSIFDSTDLSRNATDPLTTLPNPPRYAPDNTIGYVDGHVK